MQFLKPSCSSGAWAGSNAGFKGRNPCCISPFPEHPLAFPEPRNNPCTWRMQRCSFHPLLFASSCRFLCLHLINPRQIRTDSTPTHKLQQGWAFSCLKITTLSLPLIKAQHFSSYREVKFGGFCIFRCLQ